MNITTQTEAVEVCPFCEQENVYPDWDVDKQGYVARCQHCGKLCMHYGEDSCIGCNWTEEHNCFRAPDLKRD